MKKIKLKIKNFNNIIISFFNKIYQFKKYNYKKLAKISNFNKSIIFLISLLFLYLFYLSLPSLYDKERLQNEMANKLKEEFKINFSFSSEISYSILPSPHIHLKNAKIFNEQSDTLNELAQIKDVKIFISQLNLFNQNKIKIKKIIIKYANFSIKKNDFEFINNFINQKFSSKKIIIKNSNIFYKGNNNEIVSISKIYNLELFLNIRKSLNQVIAKGKIFQIPFDFKWSKDFTNNNLKKTILKMPKINLKMFNQSTINDSQYAAVNKLFIGGTTLIFDYIAEDSVIILKSNNSKLLNDNVKYDSLIQFNPFDLNLNIYSDTFNYNQYISVSNFFQELLKTDLLFNKNLNAKISFVVKDILKNKLFDNMTILLNFNNGNINFNKSYLFSDKIGKLNLDYGKILKKNNQLIFRGKFDFNIDDDEQFYKAFQIPKNNRLNVKNIYFDLEYNLFDKELKIISLKLNDLNIQENKNVLDLLDDYNRKNNTKNWIDLKSFINKIFIIYEG